MIVLLYVSFKFLKKLFIYYRFNDSQPYTSMIMTEESSGDLPSGMKAFSANIEAKTEDAVLDYYIMSENAGTVSFSPLNYFSKPYKVKLSDLNK